MNKKNPQHQNQQTEERDSRCLKTDSFLSLSSVVMKLEGWILSTLSSKSLTDVKLLQWNQVGLITNDRRNTACLMLSKVSQTRNAATTSVSPVLKQIKSTLKGFYAVFQR